MSPEDIESIILTIKLASIVTVILLIMGTPLAWWLARRRSIFTEIISAIVTLPLVLPPTVLGFYLLILMNPNSYFSKALKQFGVERLSFSFEGLIIASVVFSLPFVVQPLKNSFESLSSRPLELAATSGASPVDAFFTIVIPQCMPGFITASILGFVHTIGEFGVVLMIGGSIPGVTRVVSVQIYDHVEALNYGSAHYLSLIMIVFSFLTLIVINKLNQRKFRLI